MHSSLRVVFMGTAEFALPVLDALHAGECELLCVVTRPARKAGRGRKLTETPVAVRSMELGIPLHQPEKPNAEFVNDVMKSLEPDMYVSAAYGAYLPGTLLKSAPYGVVNVHPSMLPRFRGAEPITRAIMQGDTETGVTFMITDKGWDTGPILKRFKAEIAPTDTKGVLEQKLAGIAADEINNVITAYAGRELIPQEQTGDPCYADKIKKDELIINWNRSSRDIHNLVRALQPNPGAGTVFRGKILKIVETVPNAKEVPPGTAHIESGRILIGCGSGSLSIKQVQPAAGRIMDIQSFDRGSRIEEGEHFG